MNTYETLKRVLSGKKMVKVAKSIVGTHVAHYSTEIAIVKENTIKISSGGHLSATTKRHLNTIFKALDIPVSVYQRNNVWYVNDYGVEQIFFDGYVINLK